MKLYKYYLWNERDYLIVDVERSNPLISIATIKRVEIDDDMQRRHYLNMKHGRERIIINNKRVVEYEN